MRQQKMCEVIRNSSLSTILDDQRGTLSQLKEGEQEEQEQGSSDVLLVLR